MSRKSDGLIADMLAERWAVTHAPAAGETVVLSVPAPQSLKNRHTLDTLSYTIRNGSAGTHTVTTSVRDASIAGTVLASWDDLLATATVVNRHLNGLGIQGGKGNALVFTQDTVLAAVKATVNATGWTDESNA